MGPLSIDGRVFLTQLVGFLLLLFLIRKLLWGRLTAFLDARREEVRTRIVDSERRLADATKLRQEFEARMAKAESEAEQKLNAAVREAEGAKAQILKEARAQAEEDRAKSLRALEEEKRKAVNEIKDEVVRLSIAVSERLLERSLDEKTADRLAEDVIGEIGRARR